MNLVAGLFDAYPLIAGLFDTYPKASSTKMIAGLFDAYSLLEIGTYMPSSVATNCNCTIVVCAWSNKLQLVPCCYRYLSMKLKLDIWMHGRARSEEGGLDVCKFTKAGGREAAAVHLF